MTVSEALAEARRRLAGFAAGALEADILLRHALGVDRAWLYANGGHTLDDSAQQRYLDLQRNVHLFQDKPHRHGEDRTCQ